MFPASCPRLAHQRRNLDRFRIWRAEHVRVRQSSPIDSQECIFSTKFWTTSTERHKQAKCTCERSAHRHRFCLLTRARRRVQLLPCRPQIRARGEPRKSGSRCFFCPSPGTTTAPQLPTGDGLDPGERPPPSSRSPFCACT